MITIVAAYADLMNLYGDYANIAVLEKRLMCAGQSVAVRALSVGDEFDLSDCDLLYVGAGTETALLTALENMKNSGEEVIRFLNQGGKALFTGNAAAVIANEITLSDGTREWGLSLADYNVTVGAKRRYAEFIMKSELVEAPVIGAVNSALTFTASATPLFSVEYQTADAGIPAVEGFSKDYLYATQLTGPLLVRNPALLEYAVSELAGEQLPPCDQPWISYLRQGYESVRASLQSPRAKRR